MAQTLRKAAVIPLAATFTTSEVAELAQVDPDHVQNAAARGIANPVLRGRRGKGEQHHFSERTMLGLVTALTIRRFKRASNAQLREIVRTFERMSDSAFEQWLRSRRDEGSQEKARWSDTQRLLHKPASSIKPSDEEIAGVILAFQHRAEQAILRKRAMVERIGLVPPAEKE